VKQPVCVLDLVPGTPTTGLWCDACLLPSRITVPIYVLADDGPVQIGTIDRCYRCAESE